MRNCAIIHPLHLELETALLIPGHAENEQLHKLLNPHLRACTYGTRVATPGRMLKKFMLLTRPTPARRDAPYPKQGRSELPRYKGWVG